MDGVCWVEGHYQGDRGRDTQQSASGAHGPGHLHRAIGLSLFKRWEERRRLATEYDSLHPDDDSDDDRYDYVQRGMDLYNKSLRRKLLWGVYLVPLATIVLLILLGHLS